ncbi:hypothetical protein C0992_011229, partial [Termitomyces sp. T32_za158]
TSPGTEPGISQHLAEQYNQAQDGMASGLETTISRPELDSPVEELLGSAGLDEFMRDDFEEDAKIAAMACTSAQVILDAYNEAQNAPSANTEEDELISEAHIESLCVTQEYICIIQNATLDEDKLDKETLHCLGDPIEGPIDIISPDNKLSLEIFTATNSSQATYNQCYAAILQHYPDSNMLTFYQVKQLIASISGVVSVLDDMCINSCYAFTGPYAELDACSICREP